MNFFKYYKNNKVNRSVHFGLFCTSVGVVVVAIMLVFDMMLSMNMFGFTMLVLLSSFLTSAILWYKLIENKNRFLVKKAKKVGILSAILAHFNTFTLIVIFSYFYALLSPGGSIRGNPFSFILTILVPGAYSLILFGWVTIPAGALIGKYYMNHVLKNKTT